MTRILPWACIAILCALVIALYVPQTAKGAATTAETGNWNEWGGEFYSYPVSINWPLSTDVTEVLDLPVNYGPPVAYLHLSFEDQTGGSGGEGLAAQEVEHTFISPDDYGHASMEAYQITVHRQEYDGTISTQDSVVSTGLFLFTPITGLFD